MEPCDVCLGLSVGNELDNDRWKLVFKADDTFEHSLEFESTQMKAAAESGCVTCSIVLNGIELISRNSPLFDNYQSATYSGRIVVQRCSPLEVEILDEEQKSKGKAHGPRATPRARIQIYALPENNSMPAPFLTSRHIAPEPSVEYCSAIVLDWITNCRENHGDCVSSSDTNSRVNQLPKRLLDLKPSQQHGYSVVLIQTGDNMDHQQFRYATLSHCWGESHVIQTTPENLALRMRGIDWDDSPKTFKDAITIVRALDIRYLWIDSLCIVQDDPIDWAAESVRMAAIYSNSFINIAATGSFDSQGGCLYPRMLKHTVPNYDIKSFPIRLPKKPQAQTLYVRHSLERVHLRYSTHERHRYDLPDSQIVPLLSRAWVFQERFLAPRTLHFHPSEMIMECKTSLRCECSGLDKVMTQDSRRSLHFAKRDHLAIPTAWLDAVEEYTKLRLSRESDRLPALQGVATVFQDKLKCGYLAGIWQNDIARGILWDVAVTGLPSERRADRNRSAPSWSWASQILDVEKSRLFFLAGHDDSFQVDERFCLVETNIPLGAIDSNPVNPTEQYISLRGAAVTATLHPYDLADIYYDMALVFEEDIEDLVLITIADMRIDCTWKTSTGCSLDVGSTAYCLLVGHSRRTNPYSRQKFDYENAIVLKPTSKDGEFERVGIMAIEKDIGIFYSALESSFVVI